MPESRVRKKKGVIKTDFKGLIELLAKNLYRQEDVFVRELIENAHDAVIKRQTRGPVQARIEVIPDRNSKTVVFRDNGAGTTVTVHLRSEYLGMSNSDVLRRAVRKCADFLPFPIYVSGKGPVNTMQAPWHRRYGSDAERKETYWLWVKGRFPDFPIEIIPVDMEAPHAVYMQFAEKERGSIEAGKLTDVAVTDRDYLTCPKAEIKDVQPVMTVLDGRIVNRAQSLQ
jgi:HSP90 family molecular chaperone